MFTGLIETVGRIENIKSRAGNKIFTINADFNSAMKIGESVAIDGCCLTVIEKTDKSFKTEVTAETLKISTLHYRQPGDDVNLERALLPSDRLGGHFVSGHIDEVARIKIIKSVNGAKLFQIEVARKNLDYLVEKGSIAVDGISLTINEVKNNLFTVNIIPHTLDNTTWQYKRPGDYVNIEYDMLGKFVRAYLESKAKRF
jgi:riboflavin synthase